MLDVKRMRILKEVADRGSFSAAAEALSYTQSAVSQQIAALEREAGTQLVTRGSRGIKLTESGEALVRHADAILTRLADAEAELEAIAGLRGGRLRMAAFPTVGATLMPLAIATFRERHPEVELTVRQLEPEDSLPLLKSGDIDIALTIEPSALDDSEGLDSTFLLDDPMFAALPLNHPLAHKSRVRVVQRQRREHRVVEQEGGVQAFAVVERGGLDGQRDVDVAGLQQRQGVLGLQLPDGQLDLGVTLAERGDRQRHERGADRGE